MFITFFLKLLNVYHLIVGNRPPAKFPVPVPPSPSVKDDEVNQNPYLDFLLSYMILLHESFCQNYCGFLNHAGTCMAINCLLQSLGRDSFVIALQVLTQPQELSKQGCILEAAIKACAKEIISLKDSLNEWDSKVGDGDCGTTVSQLFFNSKLIRYFRLR
jgi:hypothetical protein